MLQHSRNLLMDLVGSIPIVGQSGMDLLHRQIWVLEFALPKPGCRHPDSASKPCLKVSLHTAPQQFGACYAHLSQLDSLAVFTS